MSKGHNVEIRRRLENWARWHHGGARIGRAPGNLAISPFPAYNLIASAHTFESTPPISTLAGEAEDTDKILRKMQPRLAKALKLHYLQRGTPKWKARQFGKIAVRTFYRMVDRGELIFGGLCWPRHPQPQIAKAASEW